MRRVRPARPDFDFDRSLLAQISGVSASARVTAMAASAPTRRLQARPTIDAMAAEATTSRAQSTQVAPHLFADGSLLQQLAVDHLGRFNELAPHRRLEMPRELSWASACSGSEGAHFVFEAIAGLYKASGVATSFRQKFACEYKDEKRKWIADVLGSGGQTCIMKDIEHLGGDSAACAVHGQDCPVMYVDVFVVGTSCKDLSSLSTKGRGARHDLVFNETWSPGGSAQTYRGFLAYVKTHRPGIVVFENVDKIADDSCDAASGQRCGSNLDLLLAEMAARGYDSQRFMVDSNNFGVPARRRRQYVVFVRTVGCALFNFQAGGGGFPGVPASVFEPLLTCGYGGFGHWRRRSSNHAREPVVLVLPCGICRAVSACCLQA